MYFERFVGLRFLKPKRRQILISAITLITITGVTVGVAALIVVISVLSGFQDNVQSRMLEAYSHLIITSYQPIIQDYKEVMEKIKAHQGVEAVSPFVMGEVMLASDVSPAGAILRGVEPGSAGRVTSLAKNMKLGRLESISELHSPAHTVEKTGDAEEAVRYPGILLGDELAAQLHAVIGSEVRVISPFGDVTPMGPVPKSRRFIVTGIFSSGLFDFDAKFAFISLEQAQNFFGLGDSANGLEVKLTDLWQAGRIGTAIVDELGWPYRDIPWMDINRNLYSAMKLEKLVMFLIVSLIVFVAALNIFSTITMMVMGKQRAIAILKTMGADNKRITRLFVAPGLIIALIGSVLGFLLGIGICLLQMKFGFVKLDPTIYWFDQLPMKFKLLDFSFIAFAAFAFSFVATIIPARIAARLDPVRVLRYE